MSERGLPIADGASACPFVAFDDDRDERAAVPDHRHRCYAEVRPAPRALAHQEAYCLSSAFPVCPTFQDWARRESARARDAAAVEAAEGTLAEGTPAGAAPAAASLSAAAGAGIAPDSTPPGTADGGVAAAAVAGSEALDRPDRSAEDEELQDGDPDTDGGARRNPPREWSAPPPWLASADAARVAPAETPDFLAGRSDPTRGLAGSAADLLAGGPPPRPVPPSRPMAPSRPATSTDFTPRAAAAPDIEEHDLASSPPPRRYPRAYDQHLGGPTRGPDWERPRRNEAYPTIRTRIGLPKIPRLAGIAAVIALAAVGLFFLGPELFGLGANEAPGASRSPSPSPSRSIAPTPKPVPTPIVYIIKKDDFLSTIAAAHGISLAQLMAANPGIKDKNKIVVGQQIIIPTPPPAVPEEFGGSASPSGAPSP